MSDMRAWLEEVADQFMRDATVTVTLPPGVRSLERVARLDAAEMTKPIGLTRVVRPPVDFVAVLDDGGRIKTTRGCPHCDGSGIVSGTAEPEINATGEPCECLVRHPDYREP